MPQTKSDFICNIKGHAEPEHWAILSPETWNGGKRKIKESGVCCSRCKKELMWDVTNQIWKEIDA